MCKDYYNYIHPLLYLAMISISNLIAKDTVR